jgi:hypothetical protein
MVVYLRPRDSMTELLKVQKYIWQLVTIVMRRLRASQYSI